MQHIQKALNIILSTMWFFYRGIGGKCLTPKIPNVKPLLLTYAQVAVKNNIDVFYFSVLIPLNIFFVEDGKMGMIVNNNLIKHQIYWHTTNNVFHVYT